MDQVSQSRVSPVDLEIGTAVGGFGTQPAGSTLADPTTFRRLPSQDLAGRRRALVAAGDHQQRQRRAEQRLPATEPRSAGAAVVNALPPQPGYLNGGFSKWGTPKSSNTSHL